MAERVCCSCQSVRSISNSVCCLCRISTAKQIDHDGQNQADIPVQRKACREFAKRMGWIIAFEEQETGVSGFKTGANEGERQIDTQIDRLTNDIRFWQADSERQKPSMRTKAALGQDIFYDLAEGLLASLILLLADLLPPDEQHPAERRHIVSGFKLVQDLLECGALADRQADGCKAPFRRRISVCRGN